MTCGQQQGLGVEFPGDDVHESSGPVESVCGRRLWVLVQQLCFCWQNVLVYVIVSIRGRVSLCPSEGGSSSGHSRKETGVFEDPQLMGQGQGPENRECCCFLPEFLM